MGERENGGEGEWEESTRLHHVKHQAADWRVNEGLGLGVVMNPMGTCESGVEL
jgi:hypothetical protein